MSYSIKEILDIAAGIEETGYNYYTMCLSRFKDEKIQEVFSFLAKEELEHKKIFEEMGKDAEETTGIYTEEYHRYLKILSTGKVFKNKERMEGTLSYIDQPVKAIQKALLDEKDAILFYSEIKNTFDKNSKEAELLDKIIAEERKHAITLVDIKKNFSMASSYNI